MGKLVNVTANLIQLAKDGEIEALAHGCNCFCRMGAGFAGKLVRVFPDVLLTDMSTKVGDVGKLGTFTVCQTYDFPIFNLYTQFQYGLGKNHFDSIAFRCGLIKVIDACIEMKIYSLHIPKIGSHLAGGNWEDIYFTIVGIIENHFRDVDFTLVVVTWI